VFNGEVFFVDSRYHFRQTSIEVSQTEENDPEVFAATLEPIVRPTPPTKTVQFVFSVDDARKLLASLATSTPLAPEVAKRICLMIGSRLPE
jgi:hypothetical protein